MEPLEPIDLLISRALELWRLLLHVEHPWWEDAVDNPGKAAQVAVLRDGKPYTRVGYLIAELFTTLAKADETLELARQMWPGLTTRGHLWRVNALRRRVPRNGTGGVPKTTTLSEDYPLRIGEIVHQEGDLVPYLEDREVAAVPEISPPDYSRLFSVVRDFIRTSDGLKPAPFSNEPESLYFALCKYRDEHALAKEAERYDVPAIALNGGQELTTAIANLEGDDRRELVSMVRRFRVQNRLFGWLQFGNGERTNQRYPALFEGLVERPLDPNYVDFIVAAAASGTQGLTDEIFPKYTPDCWPSVTGDLRGGVRDGRGRDTVWSERVSVRDRKPGGLQSISRSEVGRKWVFVGRICARRLEKAFDWAIEDAEPNRPRRAHTGLGDTSGLALYRYVEPSGFCLGPLAGNRTVLQKRRCLLADPCR